MKSYNLNHLKELESEAIFVIREIAAQFEKPVLLFSGGKDSIILFHLAKKAFYPGKIPFPLMHIDTGHNFKETLLFRDKLIEDAGEQLIVKYVQDSINKGTAFEEKSANPSRNGLQTITLLEGLEEEKFDAAMGGARRDEEKARAKERFFSHRDEFGQWDPKNQRPELWNIFNGKKNIGEHFRIFPISNWSESFESKLIRCRTIGDMTCTGVVESSASSIEDIIKEVSATRITERGGRTDDKRSEAAMEDRKKQGYF